MTHNHRSYEEMLSLSTFLERFEYLALRGSIGLTTFGAERHLNQAFYNSTEWKQARRAAIVRDFGRDLAIEGREIHESMVVHHINPLRPKDVMYHTNALFDLSNLITTTHQTHKAIHYGDASGVIHDPVERKPGDTKFW